MKTPANILLFLAGLGVILGLWSPPARAFSLLGPLEPWMTATNGFPPSAFAFLNGPEIGGPMTISNGYRWNVPVVTYGFDPSFLDYFGSNGVAAVENAISLLNHLPPASQLNPDSFSTNTTHINYRAQSEFWAELKSETLFLLLEHLGLASPDVYIFTIKDFTVTGRVVAGDVLLRNYDPVTYLASSNVNTILITYYLKDYVVKGVTNVQIESFSTDPLGPNRTAVADGSLSPGLFYAGLTRDDIGGLRYLYSPKNVAYETLLPDVRALKNPGVNGAWRAGVDKVTFVPQPVNPATHAFLPMTYKYLSTCIINHLAIPQLLERTTVKPDFLFSARDFLFSTTWYDRTGTTNWINNAALNGRPAGAGPGVIPPPVNIVFNKLGPIWEVPFPWLQDGDPAAPAYDVPGYATSWATYDGTTNPPITYPVPKPGTNQTPVYLSLFFNVNEEDHRWLVTGTNRIFNFQTSTNLANWTTLFAVTNNGSMNTYFNSSPSSPHRFYRVVPQ